MKSVSTTALVHTALRLTLLQSAWREGSMQSIGLSYCLMPCLESLANSKDDLRRLLVPYSIPFNTHPFLVGAVAGASLRLFEDGKDGDEVATFLGNAMGPLGALGDSFLRGALPVFVTTAAAIVTIFSGPILGMIVLLSLATVVPAALRIGTLYVGYRRGEGVLEWVGRHLSYSRTKILSRLAAVGVGAVVAGAGLKFGYLLSAWFVAASGFGCVLAALAIRKHQRSRNTILAAVFFIALLVEAWL